MKLIFNYLKDNLKFLGGVLSLTFIYLIVFFLYNLPLEPIFYGLVLFFVAVIISLIIGFIKYKNKHYRLKNILDNGVISIENLEESKSLIEEDYKDIISLVFNEKAKEVAKGEREREEILDYFTLWAHQIKTPIAASKILLQREENDYNLAISNEVFKIEQYVNMVLSYLRLDEMSSDLVLKEYSLDDIVKQAIRKYSRLFIGKRISLNYEPLNLNIVTDEKWLLFVIEQILSNAIKYTKECGKISIYNIGKTLVIEDNGIGIEKSDLPRVFEKGFTGFNGRNDKKSTGLGLYLCNNILKKLSHKIEIESEVLKFTRVKINLETIDLTLISSQ
ncbi:sensor histidine kinase [Clostridium sp. LY3-2]|uniref:sensor histidine kinase n=1 Tax=Clostridium sp. LY3-2 TaxID=2942482 RepID=UPI0021529E0D|nr:sensor histidine kinase [Clostridium sp. LY3-2]MCR6514464.1 sensor histidine kinase [Clostridium sp. LY3-2]